MGKFRVAAVKAAITGHANARQEAAIAVLHDYIEQLTGQDDVSAQRMPEPARSRWYEYVSQIGKYEYQRTHVYLGGSDVAGPARVYPTVFRTEVLSKWVSPAELLPRNRPTMQGVEAAERRRAMP